jgi:RING/Ubox like zinc-binding domain
VCHHYEELRSKRTLKTAIPSSVALRVVSNSNMSDDEEDTHCPLCVEEMDDSDKNFIPCPCGYRVSLRHFITENSLSACQLVRCPLSLCKKYHTLYFP